MHPADELHRLMKILDRDSIGPLLTQAKTTCKPGCFSCCLLLTMISRMEAILIAQELVKNQLDRLPQLLPRLRADALAQDYEGINSKNYLQKRIPCTLLDPSTKLCTIYDKRPGVCRYYISMSDPKLCDPSNSSSPVVTLDTQMQQLTVLVFDSEFFNGPPVCAPIATSVMWALREIGKRMQPANHPVVELIRVNTEGLLSMEEWQARHHDSCMAQLTESSSRRSTMTAAELREFQERQGKS